MTDQTRWHESVSLPALLRHARATYGTAMRRALEEAGYDDIPANGLYVIGGLALDEADVPLSKLITDLCISKQAAGQLVDTLVTRGYLKRAVDAEDRRRLNITLTRKGCAAAAVQTAARQELDSKLDARIGPQGVAVARRALAALIEIGRQVESSNDSG